MELIQPSPEELRRLQRQCRAEIQPLVDEIVWADSICIRPITICQGKIEYGPHPAPIQSYIDELQGQINSIVNKYKALAEGTNRKEGEGSK